MRSSAGDARTWLVVYVVLPPAVLAVALAHELGGGREEWRMVTEPMTSVTKLAFATCAIALVAIGLWLMFDPRGGLAREWPCVLPPVSATVVGTWLLTVATPFAWALAERDWRRVRIAVGPVLATVALHLAAAVRFGDHFSGDSIAVGSYIGALVALAGVVGVAWLSQRRARVARPSVAGDYAPA